MLVPKKLVLNITFVKYKARPFSQKELELHFFGAAWPGSEYSLWHIWGVSLFDSKMHTSHKTNTLRAKPLFLATPFKPQ